MSAVLLRYPLFAVLLLVACGVPADPCDELSQGGDRAGTAVELEQLRSLRASTGAPGVILAVSRGDGPMWIGAAGCGSLEPRVPLTPESRFLIGSVTKTFSAALMLRAQREGRLDLDDPLATQLPELTGLNGATLRQALNHTSGLYNFNEDDRFRERIAAGWTSQQFAVEALTHKPYFDAGEGFHYSNTNYVLAGMAAERALGESLVEALHSRLFDPLGLTATRYFEGEPAGEFVSSYQANCGFLVCDGHALYPADAYTPFPGFAGAIASSARDTLTWANAISKGDVLTEQERGELRGFVDIGWGTAAPEAERYGLGWMDYGDGAEGHTGLMPGFHSVLAHRADADLTVVAFVNEMGNGETFVGRVLGEVVPALAAEGAR